MPALHAKHEIGGLFRANEGAWRSGCRHRHPAKRHARRQAQDAFRHRGCRGRLRAGQNRSKPLDRKPSVPLGKILNTVAAGAADPDLVSALAARLARLEVQLDDEQQAEIAAAADGKSLQTLTYHLLGSIDPDANVQCAAEKFGIPDGEPPTDDQLCQVEQERMQAALKPFHKPKLRDLVLNIKKSLEQVIDQQTPDQLLKAGFDAQALEKARSLITTFRQFIADHKDEIEALQILYSRPYRAGLRYRQVKELHAALQRPPLSAQPERLWAAFEAVEPDKVKGHGGKQLVDVVALVRHAIEPGQPLVPMIMTVEERYQQWLAERVAAGITFTAEQRQWLEAIRDHIASSLSIEQDDFEYGTLLDLGGLGKAYDVFGDRLPVILDELNARLAA